MPTRVKNIDVPADCLIAVDVLSLHSDKAHWGPVDPAKFYPERFSKQVSRNANCYAPFGLGVRDCVGQQFALFTIKLTLAKLVQHFDILPSRNTPKHLGNWTMAKAKNPLPILIKKQNRA